MSKGLEALEEISLLVDVRKEHINKYLNIIEKELEMAQIVKRLFKDANLRDYKYLCRSDKKLCSEEEWNKFREWIKEIDL